MMIMNSLIPAVNPDESELSFESFDIDINPIKSACDKLRERAALRKEEDIVEQSFSAVCIRTTTTDKQSNFTRALNYGQPDQLKESLLGEIPENDCVDYVYLASLDSKGEIVLQGTITEDRQDTLIDIIVNPIDENGLFGTLVYNDTLINFRRDGEEWKAFYKNSDSTPDIHYLKEVTNRAIGYLDNLFSDSDIE
jgi:hypothetical protein